MSPGRGRRAATSVMFVAWTQDVGRRCLYRWVQCVKRLAFRETSRLCLCKPDMLRFTPVMYNLLSILTKL